MVFHFFLCFRGSSEAIKQAHLLIVALIKDPDVDILQMLPKSKTVVTPITPWEKSISATTVSVMLIIYL